MSATERYAKWKNKQTPARWVVRLHNKKEKLNFKRQYQRWLNDPSFEIIEQRAPNSAKWECM
jgi:hypothetical protein